MSSQSFKKSSPKLFLQIKINSKKILKFNFYMAKLNSINFNVKCYQINKLEHQIMFLNI